MMEGLLPMLLLLAGTVAQKELGSKVFLFPKQTATAHVILKPDVKKPLQQATVCLRSYTELTRAHALFSLATPNLDNAFLIYYESSNIYSLYIKDGNQAMQTTPWSLDWKHICANWDSITGVIQFWVNGKPSPRRVLSKEFIIGADASIILGQDQDTYGGGFDDMQSFVGEISDVHMWDYVLTPEEIRRMMYGDLQGNLLNWNYLHYEIKGEVLVEPKLQSWGSN